MPENPSTNDSKSLKFQTVAKVGDIPDGEVRAFEVEDRVIAVFNIAGEISAIDDMCPHMGASLATGFVDCQFKTVACPWHGWRFHVQTGAWADNPRLITDVFKVRIQGDEIQVSTTPIEQPKTEQPKTEQPKTEPSKTSRSGEGDVNDPNETTSEN